MNDGLPSYTMTQHLSNIGSTSIVLLLLLQWVACQLPAGSRSFYGYSIFDTTNYAPVRCENMHASLYRELCIKKNYASTNILQTVVFMWAYQDLTQTSSSIFM